MNAGDGDGDGDELASVKVLRYSSPGRGRGGLPGVGELDAALAEFPRGNGWNGTGGLAQGDEGASDADHLEVGLEPAQCVPYYPPVCRAC